MKVGVIGLGKVGQTIYDVLMKHHKVRGYDKYKHSDSFQAVLDSDVIFIAVPTPEGDDGRLDCSIMKEVLGQLEDAEYKGVVVIKSTVRIGFFDNQDTNLKIVYNPEFLHEKNRWSDVENPYFVVLAGESDYIPLIKEVYCWIHPDKIEVVRLREAEMIKLIMNAFASTKISFWNQIKIICDERGVDVSRIRDILRKDKNRWSDEYTDPLKGPYGGACLPKDMRELINTFENNLLLVAVEEINEKMKQADPTRAS